MENYSAKYSLYDTIVRCPESGVGVGNVTFNILSERSSMAANRSSKRLYIIMVAIVVAAIIITAVVTWKATKDTYDNDGEEAQSVSAVADKNTETHYEDKPWLSLRLPRDVLPIHYDITMYPDFYGDGFMFYGNETIELEVSKETGFILIHIHGTYINVTRTHLEDADTGEDLAVRRTFYYEPNEFFVVEAEKPLLAPGRFNLRLQFEGSLVKNGIVGIYKSTYTNTQTNEIRHLSSSKFEPTFARQAFPCFDEPNIKAEYTISLIHHPDYIALSNMPQSGEAEPSPVAPDLVRTKFERSVKMSTYLVCFIVCDFEHKETTSESGIPIRVFATPDKVNQVDQAMDIAKFALDRYEVLFNMSYPLPKQDLIAIPDFVSGAMEHWGLITFRETRLLVDEGKSSLFDIQNVFHTVAHEMAHMWFGNIVTMDWWNDLWLNEGFATYMDFVGVEDRKPEWRMREQFLRSDLFYVMGQDSILSSHPIIVDVEHPNQITAVFDAISYYKGASVIRMLEDIMGEKAFFEGVALYLKRFKWGNARTDDLWKALSEIPQKDGNTQLKVKHIMDSWTVQDGFPYIAITTETLKNSKKVVKASQKRFLSSPNAVVNETSSPLGYKWYVYLPYATSSGVNGTEIMDMEDITIEKDLKLDETNSWVKFNHGQMGYYLVLYPEQTWRAFSQYFKTTDPSQWMLSGSDRAGLLHDSFRLAGAGLLNYELPLELLKYIKKERQFVPYATAISYGFSYVNNMLRFDPVFDQWKAFMRDIMGPAVLDIGFQTFADETYETKLLRPLLIEVACNAKENSTLDYVREQFRAWLDKGQRPNDVDLANTVYKCGMANFGSEEDWNKVWDLYLKESSPQEKIKLLDALARTKHEHLIERLLSYALEGTYIKSQDFTNTVRQVGRNSKAVDIVWNWTKKNYQIMIDRFTINDRSFGRMVPDLVTYYNTDDQLKQVKDFFKQYPEAGAGERPRKQALEKLDQNIYWMKNFRDNVADWISTNVTI